MKKNDVNSVPAIFQNQVTAYGDEAIVSYRKDGVFVDVSWNQMNDMIHKLALFLISAGIRKRDKVALFSPNRYEWWVADQAILSIGAINVPIYATNSAEETYYVLNHSDSKICFVASEEHFERVMAFKKKLPKLKKIVTFDNLPKAKNVISIAQAFEKGTSYKDKSMFDKRLKAIKPEDMATIIYTSGTTGAPKGVMLSHANFLANINQVNYEFKDQFEKHKGNNVMLSFLPLSHSFERTSGYYVPVSVGGVTVAFAEDFSTILDDLKDTRPTVMISVPRLYEKIHAGILAKVAEANPVRKILFNLVMKIAKKNLIYECEGKPRTGLFASIFNIADKVVFSKLKAALGLDRLIFACSGGGPLAVTDAEFFLGMGIVILEGFGLTETTPITNVNRFCEIKPGSVGRPVRDTKIKISDEGEVLIKGPQVMMGYFKNKKATTEVMTKDGFFRTGDIGVIDEVGRLSITGRIKDIIVTAGGKNISPQNIENNLKTSNLIEQVAVIGDRRKYLSALVIPEFEALKTWAKKNEILYSNNTDLIENEIVINLFAKEIEKYTRGFARVEQIRKFRLLNAEWTQETGELTPTLKVKRNVVNEKYAEDIKRMYPPD